MLDAKGNNVGVFLQFKIKTLAGTTGFYMEVLFAISPFCGNLNCLTFLWSLPQGQGEYKSHQLLNDKD